MSPALPVVSGREAVRALENQGFAQISQKEATSSCAMNAGRTLIVPLQRELARGTLASILRQAELFCRRIPGTALKRSCAELVPNCLAQPDIT